jgi:flagellar hook-length control protein FliK
MAAASASPAGNINALADVQKLISGLTAANSTDTETDTDSAAPKTHPSTDSGGTDASQAAAALQAASLIRPNSPLGAATLTIHAPVGSAAFADEVSARAAGLAQSGITQAQLQLSPADLGPVQVHITMQAGQASVWFGATHADTRAALEQSLPRLRELFAGAGMPLTDSGVFREPPQQQQAQTQAASNTSRATLSDTVVAPTVTQVANIRLSLLDTYA